MYKGLQSRDYLALKHSDIFPILILSRLFEFKSSEFGPDRKGMLFLITGSRTKRDLFQDTPENKKKSFEQ